MTTNVYIERFRHDERDGEHSQFDSYEAAFEYGKRMCTGYKYRVWIDGTEYKVNNFYPDYRGRQG